MKLSYSEITLLLIGTSFTVGCAGLGYYTYLKLIQIDQPQYNTPTNNQMAIELLEDGLENGQESLTECLDTNNYNKTKFNGYVANTKATVSKANRTTTRLERRSATLEARVRSLEKRLLAEREAHNNTIKKFNEYLDTSK